MASDRETSRKLLEKQQRRQAEESRIQAERRAHRRRNLLTLGTIVLIMALVVFLVMKDRSGPQQVLGAGAEEAGCTEVQRPQEQAADHIEEGSEHPPYSSDPPSSGPHYSTPADAGFYATALPPEVVVHNLEHGQIVIWYNPELPQSELDLIEELTRDEAIATLAVPYALAPPNQIAFTAWGALQQCERVSGEALNEFRAQFQGKGPENVGVPQFDLPDEG